VIDLVMLKRAIKDEDWEKAFGLLEEWREENPEHALGWYWTAVCLEKKGRFRQAREAAVRAAELDADHAAIRSLIEKLDDVPETLLDEDGEEASDRGEGDSSIPSTEVDSVGGDAPETQLDSMAGTETGTSPQWREGETIEGRYEVRKVIRGGMGEVAFVFDRELDLDCAVKTPLPRVLASSAGRARFIREAEAWISMGLHPNICTAYYLRELGGFPRLFIEFIDGGSLRGWLKFLKHRSLEQRLDIAIQIASGMEHAHSFPWKDAEGVERKGIVHRDLKPANILIGSDDLARVTDFGLVGAVEDEESTGSELREATTSSGVWGTVTLGGAVMGTPPYMPPEQWGGAHAAGKSADVYAYGVILFEIFCGLRPFGLSPETRKRRPEIQLVEWKKLHLKTAPRNPLKINPVLDRELCELMLRCLQKNPEGRPGSFHEIGDVLRDVHERVFERPYSRPRPQASRLLADSLNNRGVSFIGLGRLEQAENAWKEALGVDPDHREAGYNLALYRWRYKDAVLPEIRSSIPGSDGDLSGVDRVHWRGVYFGARLLLLTGDWDQALSRLRMSLKASKVSSRVALEYAMALCACARAKALEITDKLVSADVQIEKTEERPDEEEMWAEAAGILSRSGGPLRHDPRLLTTYALAAFHMGKEETAKRLMVEACRNQPELPAKVEDAAARILPGQVSRIRLETVASRTVRMSLSVRGGLAVALLHDNRLAIWNLDDGRIRIIHRLGGERPRSFAVDGARGLIYIAREVEPLSALDITNAHSLFRLTPHSGFLNDLKISPDGRKLVGVGSSRRVFVWDPETRRLVLSIPLDLGYLTRLDIAADCRTALVGGSTGQAVVIDLATGEILRHLDGLGATITALCLSPGARWAFVGDEDGRIGVWNLYREEERRILRGHSGGISFLKADPDSEYLLSGAQDGCLRLRRIADGLTFWTTSFGTAIQDGDADGEFSRVFVGAGIRDIWFFDLRNRPEWFPNWVVSSPVSVSEMETKSDDFKRHLKMARRYFQEGEFAKALSAIDAARNVSGFEKMPEALEFLEEFDALFPREGLRSNWEEKIIENHDESVYGLGIDREGSVLLTAGGDRCLRLHHEGTVDQLPSENRPDRVVRVSPDGTTAFSGGLDNEIRVWDLSTRKLLRVLKGHTGQINALDLRFDGNYLLSASADGELRFWDVETGDCLKILQGHRREILDCAFHPAGNLAASCGEEGVLLWDLTTGLPLSTLTGHRGAVRCVRWTGDGRKLLSGGADSSIRLSNPVNGRTIQTLEFPAGIECMEIGSEDRFLFCGDTRGEIHLVDLKNRQVIAVNSRHRGRIHDLALTANCRRCCSASADGSVRIWYLDWTHEMRARSLSKARPYLEVYLEQQKIRGRKPWEESGLNFLLEGLRTRGFGTLDADAVQRKLLEISRSAETSSLRSELEGSKVRIGPSPVEKERKRTRKKAIVLGGMGLVGLILVFSFLMHSLKPKYSFFKRQTARMISVDISSITSAIRRDTPCDELDKAGYSARFIRVPNINQAIDTAVCMEKLETGSMTETFFNILRERDPMTFIADADDAKKVIIAMLSEAPGRECRVMGDFLDDQDPLIRSIAGEALALNRNETCVRVFTGSVTKRDPVIRMTISEHMPTFLAMTEMPAEETLVLVEELAEAAWPSIRVNAAKCLYFFKGDDVEELAEKLAEDKDPKVRNEAKTYLRRLPLPG